MKRVLAILSLFVISISSVACSRQQVVPMPIYITEQTTTHTEPTEISTTTTAADTTTDTEPTESSIDVNDKTRPEYYEEILRKSNINAYPGVNIYKETTNNYWRVSYITDRIRVSVSGYNDEYHAMSIFHEYRTHQHEKYSTKVRTTDNLEYFVLSGLRYGGYYRSGTIFVCIEGSAKDKASRDMVDRTIREFGYRHPSNSL